MSSGFEGIGPRAHHHAGGTTFRFVTGGIRAALDRAKEASNGQDVRLGGGGATMNKDRIASPGATHFAFDKRSR